MGFIPLIAVEVLQESAIDKLPGFKKRMHWFLKYRRDLAHATSFCEKSVDGRILLSIPCRGRLESLLRYLLDENEFLSKFGVRSVSKFHAEYPFVIQAGGEEYRVDYIPGEGNTRLFGGNSNWRGPVWFPINYLIVEALERYSYFYSDRLLVEIPHGSGHFGTLAEAAALISDRLSSIFLPDGLTKQRPCFGNDLRYAGDPHWQNLLLFNEYFHGETGRGLGATHQTGWTALVTRLMK